MKFAIENKDQKWWSGQRWVAKELRAEYEEIEFVPNIIDDNNGQTILRLNNDITFLPFMADGGVQAVMRMVC